MYLCIDGMYRCTCVLMECTGVAGMHDDLKTSTSLSSPHRTRVVWQSSNAVQPASNTSPVPMHRDSTVLHRDVTDSQSKATHLQREALTRVPEPEMSSIFDPSSCHSVFPDEPVKPRMHSTSSVKRSEHCSVPGVCRTGAVNLSGWETGLADDGVGLLSHPDNQTTHRKSNVMSENVFSQRLFSDNNNTGVQGHLKHGTSSRLNRSEWKPVQDTRASVNGCHQSGIVTDHDLSTNSGRVHHSVSDKHQLQNDAGGDSMQQVAEKEGCVTRHLPSFDGVNKPERVRGWSSAGANRHGNCSHIYLAFFVVLLHYVVHLTITSCSSARESGQSNSF